MTSRSLLALAAIAAALSLDARDATAQRRRQPSTTQSSEPTMFASGWIGIANTQLVDDGVSQSSWDFGTTVQFRGTLEYAIGNESSIGVAGSYARTPLYYSDLGTAQGCGGCDAHATIQSIMALFHLGGRPGFHQVIELAAGVRQYSAFEQDSPSRTLAPKSDTDFAFSVAYGFGYGLSRTTAIQVVQEYANALHQHDGLPGNAQTNGQQYVTRIGMRVGF